MKMLTAFFLYLLFSQMAFAGGGVVVGNGAGIAENNFQYAYQSLDTILIVCIFLPVQLIRMKQSW